MKNIKSCWELFGVECGRGWKSLYGPVLKLCEEKNATVMQVKEKYGELRIYIAGGDDEIHDAIEQAEIQSRSVCEQCGAPGKLREGGWMVTLCDVCNQQR